VSWDVEDVTALQSDCVCDKDFSSPARNPDLNPERRRRGSSMGR
jgi:hypothetical protein